MKNETATFPYKDVRYEVDIKEADRPETLIARLPDGALVRVEFPPFALPTATQIRVGEVGREEVHDARVYIWIINFPAFDRRYEVTIPPDVKLLHECLGKLPDGRYIVLDSPFDIPDAPLEQIVNPSEPLFVAAAAAGRIFEVREVS